jgi:3,5-epimerase/4-reductase
MVNVRKVYYTMRMKIVIFGGRGYLGEHFLRLYPQAVAPSADIGDRAAIVEILEREKPDVVINAAGKTGRPNVDWCEDHKEETLHANVTGPIVLLEECSKRGIYWVHLSSGCIYTGDNGGEGFSEEDEPNFTGSFYSRTKTWAETILREFPVLILRLRMPFDDSTNDRSLIMKVRKFSKVNDVQNSVTYLPDFLKAAEKLIGQKKTGIYNVVNPGPVSPYQIVELYKEVLDPTHTAERVPLEGLAALSKAGRSNCVLSTKKLEEEGIIMRPVEEAIRTAMQAIKTA